MKVIWKFRVFVGGREPIRMPKNAKVVHFGCKDDLLWIWAMVDPEEENVPIVYRVVGTGEPMDTVFSEHFQYWGTTFQGPFVWHLFLRGREEVK